LYNKSLLILACPRSATRYITHILQLISLQIEHEIIGEYGCVTPYLLYDNPWYPSLQSYHFTNIFHQIRHPLHVIESLVLNMSPEWWQWQEQYTFIHYTPYATLYNACEFYIRWNEIIQSYNPTLIYRIEDLQNVWKDICKIVHLSQDTPIPQVSLKYGSNLNTQGDLQYKDLGIFWGTKIKNIALTYGYKY
jgi:hypothetical protein